MLARKMSDKKKHWTTKLKEENKALRKDLIEVVVNPDSLKSVHIKASIHFQVDLEKAVWFGNRNKE